jgi:hypothetical protein
MSKKTAVISGSTAALALLALAGFGDLDGMTNGMPDWRPPEPEADPIYEAAVTVRTVAVADLRKAKRTRKRLEALCAGGWQIEFEPRKHFGLQDSTRPERRRVKLGRA